MPRLALICALAQNRAIGLNNQLPWHLPNDLQFFKRTTLGKAIIMGRKTYESIGKPLPGRRNIVITRQAHFAPAGVVVAHSLEDALQQADTETAFVIGGGQLYAQALPLAQQLYLTQVHTQLDGDTFFPEINLQHWQCLSQEHHPQDDRHAYAMDFQLWQRRAG